MAAAASKAGKAKSTLIPLGDRVVVEREESEQTTSGGILLPDSAKDKPARGVVASSFIQLDVACTTVQTTVFTIFDARHSSHVDNSM